MTELHLKDNLERFSETLAFIELAIVLVNEIKIHFEQYKKPIGYFDSSMVKIETMKPHQTINHKIQKNNNSTLNPSTSRR